MVIIRGDSTEACAAWFCMGRAEIAERCRKLPSSGGRGEPSGGGREVPNGDGNTRSEGGAGRAVPKVSERRGLAEADKGRGERLRKEPTQDGRCPNASERGRK